jgi:hypothetical protein
MTLYLKCHKNDEKKKSHFFSSFSSLTKKKQNNEKLLLPKSSQKRGKKMFSKFGGEFLNIDFQLRKLRWELKQQQQQFRPARLI